MTVIACQRKLVQFGHPRLMLMFFKVRTWFLSPSVTVKPSADAVSKDARCVHAAIKIPGLCSGSVKLSNYGVLFRSKRWRLEL